MIIIPAVIYSCFTWVDGQAYHAPARDACGLGEHLIMTIGYLAKPGNRLGKITFLGGVALRRAMQTESGADLWCTGWHTRFRGADR